MLDLCPIFLYFLTCIENVFMVSVVWPTFPPATGTGLCIPECCWWCYEVSKIRLPGIFLPVGGPCIDGNIFKTLFPLIIAYGSHFLWGFLTGLFHAVSFSVASIGRNCLRADIPLRFCQTTQFQCHWTFSNALWGPYLPSSWKRLGRCVSL